jgi:YegS/Rv2252/BmrU family lipid kinase
MGLEHAAAAVPAVPQPSIRRVAVVINPLSGAGMDRPAAVERTALVRDVLQRAGIACTINVTERAGHARSLAAAAVSDGAELVIVWGGDGTVNEAGSALAGTATALGIVPAGSGNGLAASLCVPRDPRAALARALGSAVRTVDAGMLDRRYFFNIAGVGVDARIAECFNGLGRGHRGRWPYIRIGLREARAYRARTYKVSLDGVTRHVAALLIAFANGREYGMGACISPGALLDDGLLEATIVEDRPVLSRLFDARHLVTRSVAKAPGVVVAQVRTASVATDGPLQYHVDGEPGTATGRVDVTIVPGALRVRA